MTAELTRVRFSVADYHRMGELGILGPEDRVELIDGEIVSSAAVGSLHLDGDQVLGPTGRSARRVP